MRPFLVATFPALGWWRRSGGIAFEPGTDIKMIELLGPKQTGERLAHHCFCVVGKFGRHARSVKLVSFFLAKREETLKPIGKVIGGGDFRGALGVRGRGDDAG